MYRDRYGPGTETVGTDNACMMVMVRGVNNSHPNMCLCEQFLALPSPRTTFETVGATLDHRLGDSQLSAARSVAAYGDAFTAK